MTVRGRIIDLVAHRGNALECPENTVIALRSALDLGVRFLEIDVQLAADAVPLVIHDPDLTRTTGRSGRVMEIDSPLLLATEAAERERFGDRFEGTRLPALGDVVDLLRGRPDVTLFVEIKRESLGTFGHDQTIARVLEVLQPIRSQSVVISFDLLAVHRARQTGGVRIGWVLSRYDDHTRLKYEALQPDFLFCNHERLPPAGALWRGPWRWALYEVQTLALALELAARGAALIETMAVRSMTDELRAYLESDG